jgi:hypothetical protein
MVGWIQGTMKIWTLYTYLKNRMPFGLKNILESEMRLITISVRSIAGPHQKYDVKAPRVLDARNNNNVVTLRDWTIGMMQYLHLNLHQWDIHRVSTHTKNCFAFFFFFPLLLVVTWCISYMEINFFSSSSRTTNNW